MHCQLYLTSLMLFLLAINELKVLGQQAEYLGCFDLNYALRQNMHEHIINVRFASCASHCKTKGTMQIGIEKSDNFCYCGDDIAEESTKRSDAMCNLPCGEGNNNTCGGDWLMSVYRFSVPTTTTTTTKATVTDTGIGNNMGFLLGLGNGVRLYRSNSISKFDIIASSKDYIYSVDYHYSKGWAYHWANKRLLRTSLAGKRTVDEAVAKEVRHTASDCEGFAVDWVEDRLYYAECSANSNRVQIFSTDLEGNNVTKLLIRPGTDYVAVKRVEVDPYRKKLFWTADGVVESYDILGKNYNTNVSAPGVAVRALSLDLEARRVFYIGLVNSSTSLYSMDYQGGKSTIHYATPQMSSVYGMGVFKDSVYWINYGGVKDIIYQGPKTWNGTLSIRYITNIERAVWHMRLVHPELQRAPKSDPCPEGFKFLQGISVCIEERTTSTTTSPVATSSFVLNKTHDDTQSHISTAATEMTLAKDATPTIHSITHNPTKAFGGIARVPINYTKDADIPPPIEAQVRSQSTNSLSSVILLSLGLFVVGVLLLASLAYFGDKYSSTIRGRLLRVSYQRDRSRGESVTRVGRTGDHVTLI